jgi:molecular chaperone GrpE
MSDHDPIGDDGQQDDTTADRSREHSDAATDAAGHREEPQAQQPAEQGTNEQGTDERGPDEQERQTPGGSAHSGATEPDDNETEADAETDVSESGEEVDREEDQQDAQTGSEDIDGRDDVSGRLATLEDRLDETQEQISDLKTQLEDYERRNDREHEELRKYAVEDLAAEMLKVKDSLMDAIEMEELEAGTEQRLQIVGKQFDKVLTSGRIDRIEPDEGDPYDDDQYRMVEKEATDEYEPNHVVRVQEIGYRIHDRVIRPARVVVAKTEP